MNYSSKITESIPEYFFVYDAKKQKIIYLSDSFKKFNIKGSEDLYLNQIRSLIHESYLEAFDEIFESMAKGRNFLMDEDLRCNESTGVVKWVNIKTHPMASSDKNLIAGHVVDVTDKIFHLQNLEKEVDELEHIIHVMAHDLRGPLGSILNLFELQKEALSDKDIHNSGVYLDMSNKIADSMRLTINSMIEMIKLKSERFQLQASNTNVTELVQDIILIYKFDMTQKGIMLYNALPEHDIYVKLDKVKFQLIIQNLLSNAIKFTDEGGKITVSLTKNKNNIEVSISDTGIGIPEDKHEQIFDEFTEMKRKGTKGEKSTGLGLSIAKRIIDVHNGQIHVRSSPGKGTTFIVTIPIIE